MIIGIGHDIVQVNRVAAVLEGKAGKRFMERILTECERDLAEQYTGARLYQFTAGRFAAKEAVAKAFGTGLGAVLSFTDIGLSRDVLGKPQCSLTERAWDRLGLEANFVKLHVTITHEHHLASAFAVVERL